MIKTCALAMRLSPLTKIIFVFMLNYTSVLNLILFSKVFLNLIAWKENRIRTRAEINVLMFQLVNVKIKSCEVYSSLLINLLKTLKYVSLKNSALKARTKSCIFLNFKHLHSGPIGNREYSLTNESTD